MPRVEINGTEVAYELLGSGDQAMLAREIGAIGVRVNGIMPGFIDTESNREYLSDPANLRSVLNNTPLGRLGEPEDVAAVVVALCSDTFRFVTGQIMEVGGGFDTVSPASSAN